MPPTTSRIMKSKAITSAMASFLWTCTQCEDQDVTTGILYPLSEFVSIRADSLFSQSATWIPAPGCGEMTAKANGHTENCYVRGAHRRGAVLLLIILLRCRQQAWAVCYCMRPCKPRADCHTGLTVSTASNPHYQFGRHCTHLMDVTIDDTHTWFRRAPWMLY